MIKFLILCNFIVGSAENKRAATKHPFFTLYLNVTIKVLFIEISAIKLIYNWFCRHVDCCAEAATLCLEIKKFPRFS